MDVNWNKETLKYPEDDEANEASNSAKKTVDKTKIQTKRLIAKWKWASKLNDRWFSSQKDRINMNNATKGEDWYPAEADENVYSRQ